MPEQKRTTETRYLSGQGEVEWSRLREEASELTCAWANYDGFTSAPAPTKHPHTATSGAGAATARCCCAVESTRAR